MIDTISYRDLLFKIKEVKTELTQLNYWKNSARFDLNIRLLDGLTIAFEKNDMGNFLHKNNQNSECLFMLKEVREFVEAFNVLLPKLNNFDKESIYKLKNNIKHILSGPQFTSKENFDNSKARNYLFEIITAVQFMEFGANIQFRIHPDVLVETSNNKYMVECKRIVTSKNQMERLEKLSIEACEQLYESKKTTGLKMGIISLDLSSMLEQGYRLFPAKNEDIAYKETQTIMQKSHKFLLRNKKIQHYANRGLLTGCFMNISVMSLIENKLPTWTHQIQMLAFTKENPNRAKKLLTDFDKESIVQSIDEEVYRRLMI